MDMDKNSTVQERLKAFLETQKLSNSEFGRRIGVSSAYVTSIRRSIQPDKLEKIAQEFPSLNITWLVTGEGEMLKRASQNVGDINGNAQGVNVNGSVNINGGAVDRFLDEIEAQRRMTEKCMEQIDRLIKLLEDKK